MNHFVSFEEHKKKLLTDPEVRRHYDELAPEYELIASIIDKRLKRKMSQQELAIKVGTGQSAISRLESGTSNPSLAFLRKVADALGTDLHVSFR